MYLNRSCCVNESATYDRGYKICPGWMDHVHGTFPLTMRHHLCVADGEMDNCQGKWIFSGLHTIKYYRHAVCPMTVKMSPQPTATQIRLDGIATCLMMAVDALERLADTFNTPLLEAISNTTQSLLKCIEVHSPD